MNSRCHHDHALMSHEEGTGGKIEKYKYMEGRT